MQMHRQNHHQQHRQQHHRHLQRLYRYWIWLQHCHHHHCHLQQHHCYQHETSSDVLQMTIDRFSNCPSQNKREICLSSLWSPIHNKAITAK